MAGERTFDLLTQAAGRAGRGNQKGRVVIQTYDPEQPVIQAAAKQDYEKFYDTEIAYRNILKYPPVYTMLGVLITAEQEEVAEEVAADLAARLRQQPYAGELRIIGPATPVISKVKDMYRRILYLKSEKEDLVLQGKDTLEQYAGNMEEQGKFRIYFDLNPMKGY